MNLSYGFSTLELMMIDEGLAFRMFERAIGEAMASATSAEGRTILTALEDSDVMPAFDTFTRTRKQQEIECVRLYLGTDATDSFIRVQTMFAASGITVVPTKGKCWHTKHMVTAEHDSVPYSMNIRDAYGKPDPIKLPHSVLHYQLTIERHHEKVKGVYEYLKETHGDTLGDIWVMIGGGSQLQAFYGNSNGYLGILYLDLEDLEEHQQLSESGYLVAVGNEEFTLVGEGIGRSYFKGMNVPGVKLR